MILSVGLSPAWQKTLVFDHFEAGEVNRAAEVYWTASGKVGNAAVAAQLIGEAWQQREENAKLKASETQPAAIRSISRALLPIAGPAREAFASDFEKLRVQWRAVDVKCPTRVCTTIVDRATRSMTELVENAGPMSQEELDRFADAYEEEAAQADVVTLAGSLPEGTPATYYRRLVELSTCPVVLDFRGPGLCDVLASKRGMMIAKPNRQELAQTVGRSLTTESELLAAMQELLNRGAEAVVVTDGAKPVRCLTRSDKFYAFPPSDLEPVSSLGCGDSLAAGLAWGIFQKLPIRETVRLGVAAAAENLTTLLPGRVLGENVLARLENIRIRRSAE